MMISCRRRMKINGIEHKLHLNTSKEAKYNTISKFWNRLCQRQTLADGSTAYTGATETQLAGLTHVPSGYLNLVRPE